MGGLAWTPSAEQVTAGAERASVRLAADAFPISIANLYRLFGDFACLFVVFVFCICLLMSCFCLRCLFAGVIDNSICFERVSFYFYRGSHKKKQEEEKKSVGPYLGNV